MHLPPAGLNAPLPSPRDAGRRPAVASLTVVEADRARTDNLWPMEREGAQSSLHDRLMRVLIRGAQVQEDSRTIVAQHLEVDGRVEATLVATRRARAARARAKSVRIQTRR